MKNHYLIYALTIASVAAMPLTAHGEDAPDNADGLSAVTTVDTNNPAPATTTEAKAEKSKKATDHHFGFVDLIAGKLTNTPVTNNKNNGGIQAAVGYHDNGGTIYRLALSGEEQDYVSMRAEGVRMSHEGLTFICKENNSAPCLRLEASVDGAYGIGTETGHFNGRGFGTVAFRVKPSKDTEFGIGGGVAAGGLWSNRLTPGTANNDGLLMGGVGANALIYLDTKYVNAALSGDYIFNLDTSDRVAGVFSGNADISVPLYRRDDGDGLDLYGTATLIAANIQQHKVEDATTMKQIDTEYMGGPSGWRGDLSATGGLRYRWGGDGKVAK